MRRIILLFTCLLAVYGGGRLYYKVTAGFCMSNITYDLPYEVRRDAGAPNPQANAILSQEFRYLGKGCQSYVFASEDGKYVIKFFKYQRFKPQWFLDYLTFLPGMQSYRDFKFNKRYQKLDRLFASWKLAYEELAPETGLLFVHLGTTPEWDQKITFYDKMGFKHTVVAGERQFLIQHRADLLCPTIKGHLESGKREEAQELITDLLGMVLGEYKRGLADNDHALMQNTGVLNGRPIHVDVGQFVGDLSVQDPAVYRQELYNKTFKFRKWLRKEDGELCDFLEERLQSYLGRPLTSMQYTGH